MAVWPSIERTKRLRSYADFRGGLNTDAAPDHVADNELVIAENVDLLERGGITKRKGTVKLNQEPYGAPVEQLIEWPRDNGEEWLLAVIGNQLCRIREDQGYTAEPLATVARQKVGYFFLQDKLYFVDGQSYRVYDGNTVEEVQPVDEPDNDLTPIKRCRFIVRHHNSYRIFAAGDPENVSALYYSEPNEPDHFKAYSVLHPTTGDGPVTALYVFGDALLVFYEHSVWVWRGLDPESDVTWHKIPTGVGTVSPYSIALTPNSLTFLGRSGLYALSPAALGYDVTIQPGDGLVTNLAKNRVEKLIRAMADPTQASAVFDAHNQRYMLAYTDENGVRNNRILVFDWSVGEFTEYTGLSCNDLLCRLNGDVLGAINQYIIKFGEGYRDFDDQPIRMVARTKQYNLDYPFHKKNLLNLYCSFRQPGIGTSEITLRLYVDDILRAEILESALYPNFVWGISKWGDIWGFRSTITTRTRIFGKGHRVQVEFRNEQLDDPTTIYGVGFEFRPARAKGRLL